MDNSQPGGMGQNFQPSPNPVPEQPPMPDQQNMAQNQQPMQGQPTQGQPMQGQPVYPGQGYPQQPMQGQPMQGQPVYPGQGYPQQPINNYSSNGASKPFANKKKLAIIGCAVAALVVVIAVVAVIVGNIGGGNGVSMVAAAKTLECSRSYDDSYSDYRYVFSHSDIYKIDDGSIKQIVVTTYYDLEESQVGESEQDFVDEAIQVFKDDYCKDTGCTVSSDYKKGKYLKLTGVYDEKGVNEYFMGGDASMMSGYSAEEIVEKLKDGMELIGLSCEVR